MLIAIEHKPRPRRTALPHIPQHYQAAKLVKTIAGINKHRSVWIRFLLQKTFGSQCQKGPLSLPLPVLASIHLHLQCHLHINRNLSFCKFTVTPPPPLASPLLPLPPISPLLIHLFRPYPSISDRQH